MDEMWRVSPITDCPQETSGLDPDNYLDLVVRNCIFIQELHLSRHGYG